MKQFGLIEKAKGDFVLTLFGRIVFHYHLVLRDMIDEHWKFKAFDHLSASGIPESELAAISGTLFESKITKSQESRTIMNIAMNLSQDVVKSSGLLARKDSKRVTSRQ